MRRTEAPYRVLHVLDHSWPVLDGYSLRSRNLIASQKSLGGEPSVLTGPLHELDDNTNSETVLDGVRYMRTPIRGPLWTLVISRGWPVLREAAVVRLLDKRIRSLIDSQSFEVIHAHSPALCGLAALSAARARKIPFVYEIRAFWEDAAVDQNKTGHGSLRYALSRGLESFAVRRADAVVGIAQAILEDLQTRGIAADKLFHIPNGVDVERFAPRPRDTSLASRLGLDNKPTLGYIGTFFRWEGIPWLVRAAVELHRRGMPFKLLIAGDGNDRPEIEAAIREAGASDYVLFLGRVPHDQVERYYSVMDVLVYPRHRVRLTEMVTPLKPLEAMALGKAVLASNVGGNRELIQAQTTGVLFEPGDVEDFCRKAGQLLRDETWRRSLGQCARQDILEKRDWKVLAGLYDEVYQSAIQRARLRG